MSKNNDILNRLDTWANRVRMNKSAETIESEESKLQDPPASSGGMAKEKEQDLKAQSTPAGAENTADGVATMRDDNTVADADPLSETKDKADSTTTEKDTAKEEAKLASLEGLLDAVASLIQSADASTKKATIKKADPTSDPTHTPEKKKDEPEGPDVKLGVGKCKGATDTECDKKDSMDKEAAEQTQVIEFLTGMWKQAGLKGVMTQEGLIKLALDRADQDAFRLTEWVSTLTKAAEEMMPPGGNPNDQDAMMQALLAQSGGAGGAGGGAPAGDPNDQNAMMQALLAQMSGAGGAGGGGGAPAGDPSAMMGGMGGGGAPSGGNHADAAAGELSSLPPEVLEQVIAELQAQMGGGEGEADQSAESAPTKGEPDEGKPEDEGDDEDKEIEQ